MFGFGKKRLKKGVVFREEDVVTLFMKMLQSVADRNRNSDKQLEEVLFQWFIIDFSTSVKLGQESEIKSRLLDSFYEKATKWFVTELHGSNDLIEQRINNYGLAYCEEVLDKDGKNLGPAWSIGKEYSKAIDGGYDLALIMKGAGNWTQQQIVLAKILTDVGY